MQPPPKRLGRGLNSLISATRAPQEEAPVPAEAKAAPSAPPDKPSGLLPVDKLKPNPFQPRREIPPEQLQALADSIRKHGILQPLVVRSPKGGVHEIIAGERRWRAAQLAGLTEVPVVIRDADDRQMLEFAIVENIFREDLNAIDRATAYRRYCDEFSLSAEEVAQRLGEDRATVSNYLRLLDLPSDVKQWVAEGQLGMGHARALLGIRAPAELARLAKRVIDEGLSVRAVEKLVREKTAGRGGATRPLEESDSKRPQIRNLEQAFVRALGTKVEINESARKGSGRIVVHYFSLDDFDRIMERLGIEGS